MSTTEKPRTRQENQAHRRWVNVTQAAEYLGVTDRTVRQMMLDGRLIGYRIGRRLIRLDLNEINAAMKPYGGAV